jgi:SulP family sulfate permease
MTIGDLAPVPAGLPPFGLPTFEHARALLPGAVAVAVLSLVESSAVARSLAGRTGDRVDASVEFYGQGIANLLAAVTGGYPVSGSLGRSVANWRAGAKTRLAGMFGGLLVLLVVLLAGPVVDYTPTASLAGLLLVVAWDLVDRARIRQTLRSGSGDGLAFLVTMVGAWTLALDDAIYLGVGLSIVMFLRRARQLVVRELVVDGAGRLREATTAIAAEDDELPEPEEGFALCPQVRILHVEGSLFFGAAGELAAALDAALSDPEIRVLIVRLKRCQGLDVTTAEVLRATAQRVRSEGRHIILVGMRAPVMERMRTLGIVAVVGEEQVFPTEPGWFVAMDHAIGRGLVLLADHHDHESCALERYLGGRKGIAPNHGL